MPLKSTRSAAAPVKKTVRRASVPAKKTADVKTTKPSGTSKNTRTTAAKRIASPVRSDKTLIVVESPTKAKTLSKILGSRYVVKASIGHIVDLPKSRMAIDINDNFKPEYILVKGKAAVKKELQSAASCAGKILLAADPDREGEAIAWHVAGLLGVDPSDDCRVRFHEITVDAVKSAVKTPGPIDMNRVDAQQARRVLDRLVGYTLSPLLWKKIKRGLSAGRVQSVALSILCEREKEIEDFVPKDYWNIFVDASSQDGRTYRLHVEKEKDVSLISEGKTLAIDTPAKVRQIEKVLETEPLSVASFTAKQNSRKQPAPFKTSTLQQLAASRLGFSPRKTMSIAQSLFEGVSVPGHGTVGLITYMRTDSLRMAPEAIMQARYVIREAWGDKYLPAKPVVYQAEAKAQDAHEAIRPTNFALLPERIKDSLSQEQFRLYDLIWRRSVASQMSPAIVDLATLDCVCGDYGLRAQGSSVRFDGWGAVWDLDMKDTMIPRAKKGELLNVDKITSEKEQTKPPARYTESSL
ncbi:MAG: type I DNA topoisomerase, partial [Firmicutes bacterium]|nr:type I DNA topoisomerase [Bacillota bacterium]